MSAAVEGRDLTGVFDAIVSALAGMSGKTPRPNGPMSVKAICPCHPDKDPSLHVTVKDGRILFDCFSQCGGGKDFFTQVMGEITHYTRGAITEADTFAEPPRRPDPGKQRAPRPPRTRPQTRPKPAAPAEPECLGKHAEHRWPRIGTPDRPNDGVRWHTYADRDGTVITYQVRLTCTRDGCDGRTFRPVTPDARGMLRQRGPKGVRPLYRLPDFLADAAAEAPVIVCEGESDTDAAAAAGWAATTMGPADHGTGSTWKPQHTADVVEAAAGRVVTIAADRDTGAGRRSARYIADQLLAAGARVRVVESLARKDVRDHLAAGHTLDEMRDITDSVLAPAHDDPDQGDADQALAPVVPIRGGGGGTGGPPSGGGGDQTPTRSIEDAGWKVPSTGKIPIYAVTDPDPDFARGLYVRGELIAPIPVITGRFIQRDNEDRQRGIVYLLAADQESPARAITGQALSRGEYIDVLGLDTPEDRGIKEATATVIRKLAKEIPESEMYARWEGDRFILPPAELLRHGYTETTDAPESEAREVWQEITSLASMRGMENTALNIGAAYSSLYVSALSTVRPVSFALVGIGAPSSGKTTNENTAAAFFGPPIHVNPIIRGSGIAMRDLLAGFGALPVFRDEIQSSPMSPSEWKQFFMSILNGAGRERSPSDGTGIVRTTRGWWGTLFLSGNTDPRYGATDGVIRRVIVLDSPHVLDGPTARYITDDLLPRAYGYPLKWFLGDHPSPRQFREDAERCTADILAEYTADTGTTPDAVTAMVAEILGVITAGAEGAAALFGGDVAEMRASAIRGALRVLGTLVDTIADLPASFADQLLDVITSDRARNPQAWPTENEYTAMIEGRDTFTTGGERLTSALPIRDVHGIQSTHGSTPVLAALAGGTGWFAQATEGADFPVREALAELRRRGVLISTRGSGYRWQHKVAGEPMRFYAFRTDPGNHDQVVTGTPVVTDGPPSDQGGNHGNHGNHGSQDTPRVSAPAREDRPEHEQPRLPDPTTEGHRDAQTPPSPARDARQTDDPDRDGGLPAGAGLDQDRPERLAPADRPRPELHDQSRATDGPTGLAGSGRADDTTPTQLGPESGTQGREDPQARRAERTRKRTADREAFDARARTAVAEGRLPRVLAALEGPYVPTLHGRRPFYAPPLPGMTDAAWVVTGYAWQREHAGPVLSLDRSGAWISGASSTTVAHGALEHTGDAVPDVSRPGYYLLDAYRWTEDGMPSPLGSLNPPDQVWVPHPTAQLLAQLSREGRWPDATPVDSYTGDPARLTAWVEWVARMRADIIDEYGRDSEEYISIKRSYGMAMSMMLGTKDESMRTEWRCKLRRPDWTHSIQSQASATLWRTADKARTIATEHAPVALRNVDELVIPPGALAALTAPRDPRPVITIDEIGRALGTYKVKTIEEWKGGESE